VIIPQLRVRDNPITLDYMRSLNDQNLRGLETALRQKLNDLENIRASREPGRLYACQPVAKPGRLRLVSSDGKEVT
jgi:hypothetical protein